MDTEKLIELRKELAKQIQDCRKTRGITAEFISQKTGISTVTIRRFESGNKSITLDNYLMIYAIVRPDTNDKYKIRNPFQPNCYIPDFILNPIEKKEIE